MKASIAATTLTSLFAFFAGTLLVILPWSALWENNHFFRVWPWLGAVLVNDVVRTAVTVLGVTDFVLGISEIRQITHRSETGSANDI